MFWGVAGGSDPIPLLFFYWDWQVCQYVLTRISVRERQDHLLPPSAELHLGADKSAGNDLGARKTVTVGWSLGIYCLRCVFLNWMLL